ncbi:hypothetical protein [Ktedonospora formicarum]|uniref:Uncharacterized protein n=1 Tax=Ktedonospora formicarum TaxID=2778364 RepID=A0A8J3HYH5_9CHLR|nr:hypothetical protein [Ktedonospora formicarum]GHO44296.1 hypothetical protein KSX_24590 [Ktedonospora formicarum]
MQKDLLQEYFIYVPTLSFVDETLTQHAKEENNIGERLEGVSMDKHWTKIALEGQLVVYAKLPQEAECA